MKISVIFFIYLGFLIESKYFDEEDKSKVLCSKYKCRGVPAGYCLGIGETHYMHRNVCE